MRTRSVRTRIAYCIGLTLATLAGVGIAMSADLVRITASSAGAIAMAGACLLVGGFALGFACALWADNVSQRRAASRDLRYVAPPAPRPNPTLWS